MDFSFFATNSRPRWAEARESAQRNVRAAGAFRYHLPPRPPPLPLPARHELGEGWGEGRLLSNSLIGISSPLPSPHSSVVGTGIPGTAVSDLTNNPAYPDNPTSTDYVTDFFEAPIDIDNDYGQRMHGFILPPQTGSYTFWISSDDNSTLFLSTDETPANVQTIAYVPGWTTSREWTRYGEQQSAPISLVAGSRYYIEALQKEGGGGDNLAVMWELPDSTMEEPIPASRLLPWGTSFTPPII